MARVGLVTYHRWIRVQFPPIRSVKWNRADTLWTTVDGIFFEWRRVDDIFAFDALAGNFYIYITLEAGSAMLNGEKSDIEAIREAYLNFLRFNDG